MKRLAALLCAALAVPPAFAARPAVAVAVAAALAVRTLPVTVDALDAAAGGAGELHVAYLAGEQAFHAVQRAGEPLAAGAALPVKVHTERTEIGTGANHLAVGTGGQIVVVNDRETGPRYRRDGVEGELDTPLTKASALVDVPGTGPVLVVGRKK